jgi:agmatinase
LRDLDMLDAQVAFVGVPYDGGTPQPGIPTGQRAGPAAARQATEAQFYYPRSAGPGNDQGAEGWYDVEADRDYLVGVTMADVGDLAIQGSDTEANYGRITDTARGIVERGALMVAIGGDHSISYPLGRGMEPLGEIDVVHVDAHTDFLDVLDGARLTGASQLRRLAELPFVGTVSALGVRNVDRACSSAGPATWFARPSRRPKRCTSRSTSTCSTPRLRRGTRCRSRVGSATDSCARSWSKWPDVGE